MTQAIIAQTPNTQSTVKRASTSRASLKKWLLTVTSGAVITMALASSASAQNNDVDAYDGTIPAGCTDAAVTAAPTLGRNGNDVSGQQHCIGDNSSFNAVSGYTNALGNFSGQNAVSGGFNTLGNYSVNNAVSGFTNALGNNNKFNAVSGHSNMLADQVRYNAVSGRSNTLGSGADNNTVGGQSNSIGDNSDWNAVSGYSNTLGINAHTNNVSGVSNTLGNLNQANTVSGVFNELGNSSGYNAVSGILNTVGDNNFDNTVSGRDNMLGDNSLGNAVSGRDNALGNSSYDNAVDGRYNSLGNTNYGNVVSGRSNALGNFNNYNTISGYSNTLGNFSDYNAVSGHSNTFGYSSSYNSVSGYSNTLGDVSLFNAVSGRLNSLGNRTSKSVVMGAYNDLCQDTDPGPGVTCAAGGTGFADQMTDMHILGSDNNIHAVGIAGSHVKILGDSNTVNGAGSGWNVITGHNATVNGTGNFLAGGNATSGPSATGDNNIAIGAGASVTSDDSIAIGTGAFVNDANGMAIGACSDVDKNGSIDPATECARSTADGAFAMGAGARASGVGSTSIGARSEASGRLSLAVGPVAKATGLRSLAIGHQSQANATDSTAVGKSATVALGHNGSSAFGFGATTSLANQMMFGIGSATYVMPGINTALSKSRQSGVIYYVTSDANGNLATTADPVPPPADSGGSSKASAPAMSGDVPMETSGPVAGGSAESATGPGNRITETGAPGETRGETVSGPVDGSLVGTNLNNEIAQPGRAIPGNRYAAASIVAQHSLASSVNSQAIAVNSKEIARNTIKINQAFARIKANTDAILGNSARITDVEEGMAAIAALPDMYLAQGDTMAASGGIAAIGDEVGFGATLAIRGNDSWSFGASVGRGGDETTGKLQVRWVK